MQEKLLGLEPLSYALKQEAGDTLEQTHPWKWSYGVEVLLLRERGRLLASQSLPYRIAARPSHQNKRNSIQNTYATASPSKFLHGSRMSKPAK